MCGEPIAYNTYATLLYTNPLFMGFSGYQNVNKEIIDCSDYIKMVQKPRKIKVFRGFLMPKIADIVCPDLREFGVF